VAVRNLLRMVSKAATFLCVKRVFTGYVAYCELSKCWCRRAQDESLCE